MKEKIVDIITTTIISVSVLSILIMNIYLLIENTRLTFVNSSIEYNMDKKVKELEGVKNELVESQNLSNGYKFQLYRINRDNGWSKDE